MKRAIAVALSLLIASPALAQMSFEGLDLGGKKAKKKKADPEKKKEPEKKPDDGDSSEVKMPAEGLDLTKPPEKTEKNEKKGGAAAPTMSFEGVDVSGKAADRQKLDAAVKEFKNDNYERAAIAAYELMNDPKMAGLATESEYLLAKSLYRMNMFHSSLGEFSKILARGPQTKFFKSSLEWLFFISRKTVNEQVVLDEIAKYSNFDFPERFRSEFRYLLARYHFVRGKALDEVDQKGEADKSFEEVKRLVLMIPKGDPFFPKGKYLEGLAYFRDNKPEAALEAMKEVVRVTRPPNGPMTAEVRANLQLRELAFMQLARTHYGAKQNRYAIYYFGKVERGNTQWLEALFESSWASYRIGKYEQSLGNLITLAAPFFRDEYFPEALILKAVIYFENCRYREALSIIEDFERIYGPVQEELDALVKKNLAATEYYTVLADVQKKNSKGKELNATDQLLERILKLALTDQDLKKTSDSINELEQEIDSFSSKTDNFKFSGLAKALIEGLKQQREQLISKAGTMSKGKLEFELDELKTLRSNGLRIKFETTTKEKEFLEESLKAGGSLETLRKYKYSAAVDDDHLYWPYVGEYWRDELGTYEYTLTKGCIEQGGNKPGAETGGR
ncbi:MAG: adventurous gliding motility protein GltC [Archangiaceae bacterium]|nr:adventurous gliding motility protein GltC [Archangiaceae bacterium]